MKIVYAASAMAGMVLMLVGCASEPQNASAPAAAPQTVATAQSQPVEASGADVQCHYEAPTGTRFKTKICTTAIQRAEAAALVRENQARGTLGRPAGGN